MRGSPWGGGEGRRCVRGTPWARRGLKGCHWIGTPPLPLEPRVHTVRPLPPALVYRHIRPCDHPIAGAPPPPHHHHRCHATAGGRHHLPAPVYRHIAIPVTTPSLGPPHHCCHATVGGHHHHHSPWSPRAHTAPSRTRPPFHLRLQAKAHTVATPPQGALNVLSRSWIGRVLISTGTPSCQWFQQRTLFQLAAWALSGR
jgi:hypothetical protein